MAMGYSPLRVEDRCLIQAQLSLRWSPAAIAAGLGRSRSTIPREIARDGWAVGAGGKRVAGTYTTARGASSGPSAGGQAPVPRKFERYTPLWELIGKGNRSRVGTLVERTTLFVALVRLDNAKAPTVADAFATILNRVDSQLRRSMTYDQGTEMAHHKTLTQKTGVAVYFAHPHSPQQRGKHQRPAAAVPAQKHRPQRVDPGPVRLHRLADQYQTTQNTRMESSRRTLPPARSLQLRDILGRIR